jgi:hypothetical protein
LLRSRRDSGESWANGDGIHGRYPPETILNALRV